MRWTRNRRNFTSQPHTLAKKKSSNGLYSPRFYFEWKPFGESLLMGFFVGAAYSCIAMTRGSKWPLESAGFFRVADAMQ
jgi:hypothetical protein